MTKMDEDQGLIWGWADYRKFREHPETISPQTVRDFIHDMEIMYSILRHKYQEYYSWIDEKRIFILSKYKAFMLQQQKTQDLASTAQPDEPITSREVIINRLKKNIALTSEYLKSYKLESEIEHLKGIDHRLMVHQIEDLSIANDVRALQRKLKIYINAIDVTYEFIKFAIAWGLNIISNRLSTALFGVDLPMVISGVIFVVFYIVETVLSDNYIERLHIRVSGNLLGNYFSRFEEKLNLLISYVSDIEKEQEFVNQLLEIFQPQKEAASS